MIDAARGRRDAGGFELAAATVSPRRRDLVARARLEPAVLILAGSAAGGVVWGWLLRRERARRRLGAHAVLLAGAAAAFPGAAAWVAGDVRVAVITGLAVAAGLGTHLAFRLALRRRGPR